MVLPAQTLPERDCVASALGGTTVLDTALDPGWLHGWGAASDWYSFTAPAQPGQGCACTHGCKQEPSS